jgi:hypothetical protein
MSMNIDAKAMIHRQPARRTAKKQNLASINNKGRECGPCHVRMYIQASQLRQCRN